MSGEIPTQAPFHLEATVRVLQRRPTNVVDVWAQDRYLRVLSMPSGLVLVEVTNANTIASPSVRFDVLHPQGLDTQPIIADRLRRILGLDLDPGPFRQLIETKRRWRWAPALRGMRPPRFAGLFETFANVIPFQQVSLEAGIAVVTRLVERFGERMTHEGRGFHGFPAASTIAEARLPALRACGMSRRKAESLRYVARAMVTESLTEEKLERLRSDDAIQLLCDLPGIGPWSAGVVLLRGLRRLEVFPPGDVGATRGLSQLLELRTDRALERAIERAGPYRGYLYFCSLGSTLLARNLIRQAPD